VWSAQREYPSGGVEQASAISRASTSPVTIGATGGVSRGLRPIVASTSPSVSANRFATTRTVFSEVPTRSAITAISNRAGVLVQLQQHPRRMIIRAGWVPDVVSLTRNSRSAADKPTVNTFGRGIVKPSSQQQRELLRPVHQINLVLAATRY